MKLEGWISVAVGFLTVIGVFFGMGYHVRGLELGLDANTKSMMELNQDLGKMEDQILTWLDDAEKERGEIKKKVTNTNNFLIRKFPEEYQTY